MLNTPARIWLIKIIIRQWLLAIFYLAKAYVTIGESCANINSFPRKELLVPFATGIISLTQTPPKLSSRCCF
jgi:hypothetical protein